MTQLCSVAVLLLLASCCSWTQERVPDGIRHWDINIWAAGATGEENLNSLAEAQIFAAGFLLGKDLTGEVGTGWMRGRFEYAVDLVAVFVHVSSQRLYGGGFEPLLLRWNSGLRTRRLAPYIELAGGALRSTANLPAGNTSDFNFTARGGGGIEVLTGRRQALDLGCHWWHISNANLGVRNPEFNGIQLSLGYHWFK